MVRNWRYPVEHSGYSRLKAIKRIENMFERDSIDGSRNTYRPIFLEEGSGRECQGCESLL